MGGFSLWHWMIILAVAGLLFGGKGKISGLMSDFGKGIRAFKAGMKEEDDTSATAAQQLTLSQATPHQRMDTPTIPSA